MKSSFISAFVGILLVGFGAIAPVTDHGGSNRASNAQVGQSVRGPRPDNVFIFFGEGDTNPVARSLAKRMDGQFYLTSQVVTLEQLTHRAIIALKEERRKAFRDDRTSASIGLREGGLLIRLNTEDESCWVLFDSQGLIAGVGGAKGYHGEGAWRRAYTNGLPAGPASRGQPARPGNTSPASEPVPEKGVPAIGRDS